LLVSRSTCISHRTPHEMNGKGCVPELIWHSVAAGNKESRIQRRSLALSNRVP
jgi:hypothetical protein